MNAAAQFPAQHRFVLSTTAGAATGQGGIAVVKLAKLYMTSYLLESAGMPKVIWKRPAKLKSAF